MMKFYISKVIATADISTLVSALNARTRDGHIACQTRIDRNHWLLRVACTYRDDADLIRDL